MVATKTFIEDDVVISGMSGRFPECDSIEEFYEKLFSGIDLVHDNDTRWPKGKLKWNCCWSRKPVEILCLRSFLLLRLPQHIL